MKKTLKQINGEMVALNDQINREQDATKKAELVAKFEDLKREAQIAKDAEQAEINEKQMRSIQPVKSAKALFRELIKRAIGVKEGIDITREGDDTPAAEEPAAPTTRECPYCMSTISIKATKCPICILFAVGSIPI